MSCCNNCLKLQFPIWQVKSFKVRIQNVEKEELQTSRSLFPVWLCGTQCVTLVTVTGTQCVPRRQIFAKFFLHQVKVFSASPPVGEKTQQCVSVMATCLLPHLDNDDNNNNKTLTITITLNNNTESPASPACQGASQTGSCTHGRCSSGPPGDRW